MLYVGAVCAVDHACCCSMLMLLVCLLPVVSWWAVTGVKLKHSS